MELDALRSEAMDEAEESRAVVAAETARSKAISAKIQLVKDMTSLAADMRKRAIEDPGIARQEES